MATLEFPEIENTKSKLFAKYTSLVAYSFYIFGLVNILGIISSAGRQHLFHFVNILNILVVLFCFWAGTWFKRASAKYNLIIATDGNDLDLSLSAARNLQKALTFSSAVIIIMLIRAISFHAAFDIIAK